MEATATVPERVSPKLASLSARAVAFAVDSVVLFTFLALAAFVAGFQLLIRSDFGEVDPPDSAFNTILGIGLATPFVWGAFNWALYAWRSQTAGKYVAAIKVVRTSGDRLGIGGALLRLVSLDPLLFHPLLCLVWAFNAAVVTSLITNELFLAVLVAGGLLSLMAPVVAAIMVLTDRQRRALHDRVAGTMVIPAVPPGDD